MSVQGPLCQQDMYAGQSCELTFVCRQEAAASHCVRCSPETGLHGLLLHLQVGPHSGQCSWEVQGAVSAAVQGIERDLSRQEGDDMISLLLISPVHCIPLHAPNLSCE